MDHTLRGAASWRGGSREVPGNVRFTTGLLSEPGCLPTHCRVFMIAAYVRVGVTAVSAQFANGFAVWQDGHGPTGVVKEGGVVVDAQVAVHRGQQVVRFELVVLSVRSIGRC